MRVEQTTSSSWRKQPTVNFMERMTTTSPLDKLQVIGGDGKALPKSPYYNKIKTVAAAYQSFYSIPEKTPEIKISKGDKPEQSKVNQDTQIQKLDKTGSNALISGLDKTSGKTIELGPFLKPVEQSPTIQKTQYNNLNNINNHSYKGSAPQELGKNIDIYI